MCFHRPCFFYLIRNVVGIMVGVLTDSPAFPLFFQTPSLFFSRCAELIDARKIHIIIKKKKTRDKFSCGGCGFEPPSPLKKRSFWLFFCRGGENTQCQLKQGQNGKNCTLFLKDLCFKRFLKTTQPQNMWLRLYISFQEPRRGTLLCFGIWLLAKPKGQKKTWLSDRGTRKEQTNGV